jgi:hypothetical protein
MYRNEKGLQLLDRGFDDDQAAEFERTRLHNEGFEDVAVLIDLKTADENAETLAAEAAFTPVPLRVWNGRATRRGRRADAS